MSESTNKNRKDQKDNSNAAPDYPPYNPRDDIYNKDKKIPGEDGEGKTGKKVEYNKNAGPNERNFGKEMGSDLDVPGSELDDSDEDIGEEDEENNFYSLGGDKED